MKKLCIVLCLLLAGVASADGLLQNTTPAERMRGCSFADHFRSDASVEAYGGTLGGNATTDIEDGLDLDGSGDYVVYNMLGNEFGATVTVVTEFTPDFDTDEDAGRSLYDATNGARYGALKQNNAASNVLNIYMGNTLVAQIPEATYNPAWLVSQRNVLVVSGTTGDTDAWLNGTQILTNDATAWSYNAPTEFYVGSHNGVHSTFDGKIHSIRVFRVQLDAAEATDYYDHSTYKYMESATAVYQMRAEDHDPTNNRTLDSSGNAKHITDVSDPVKLATHGYDYDGANDYHHVDDSAFTPAGDFSATVLVRGDLTAAGRPAGVWDNGGDQRCWSFYFAASDAIEVYISDDGTNAGGHLTSVTVAAADKACQAGHVCFCAFTYDYTTPGLNSTGILTCGGSSNTSATMSGPAFSGTAYMGIGAGGSGDNKFPGEVLDHRFLDGQILTPLQIEDARMQAWKGLNRP